MAEIIGTEGPDVLSGGDGDIVFGLGGNDYLNGGAGDVELHGGEGDDNISSLTSDHALVYGDGGWDVIFTGLGDDEVHGGEGEDLIFTDYYFGSAGDDVVYGDAGDDLVEAGPGNDILHGGADSDGLLGWEGDDILHGEEGDDSVQGGDGDNQLYGGPGLDFLSLAIDPDGVSTVLGGDDNDILYIPEPNGHTLDGGAGQDTLYAAAASATIDLAAQTFSANGKVDPFTSIEGAWGSWGNDVLIGDAQANWLLGSRGEDLLEGGPGDDVLIGSDMAGRPFVSGGLALIENPGEPDTVSYANAPGAVSVFLDDIQPGMVGHAEGADGFDLLYLINNAIGSQFDDFLYGDGLPNAFSGMGGDDRIEGFDGDDTLSGGEGADVLLGGAGNDRFVQGVETGIDSIHGGTAGADSGFDRIDYAAASAGVIVQLSGYATTRAGVLLALFSGLEGAVGSNFDDALIGTGADNRFAGGAGADWIVGGGGDDWFIQGVEGGVDRLFGGTSIADAGIDTIDYSAAGAGIVVQLNGWSTMSGGTLLATFAGMENVVGSAFSDALIGSAGDNRITGGAGADWLVGGAGDDWFVQDVEGGAADRLFGGMSTGDAGFDTLDYSAANEAVIVQLSGYSTTYARTLLATFSGIEAAIGTAYADALIGNAAGNVLRGGQGADWLVGGAGADRFVYQGYQDWFGQSYEGQDTIADFGDGDVIDIAAIDANWTLSGDQAFAFSTTRHSGVVGEAVVTNYGNGSVITLYFNEDNGVDMTLYVIHASGFGMDAGDFVL